MRKNRSVSLLHKETKRQSNESWLVLCWESYLLTDVCAVHTKLCSHHRKPFPVFEVAQRGSSSSSLYIQFNRIVICMYCINSQRDSAHIPQWLNNYSRSLVRLITCASVYIETRAGTIAFSATVCVCVFRTHLVVRYAEMLKQMGPVPKESCKSSSGRHSLNQC